MPIAFSRSLRSLHADGRSRRGVWILLLPLLVLCAWTAWFLGARVARFETSVQAHVEPSGILVATFTPSALAKIRVGQAGHLQTSATSVPVHVSRVAANVELTIDRGATPLAPGPAGTVEVQVESLSPAALLLRAAGYGGASP